jgi:hypothetical protein
MEWSNLAVRQDPPAKMLQPTGAGRLDFHRRSRTNHFGGLILVPRAALRR